MSGFIGQVRALPVNAFVRGQPDDTYADGDDSTWISVDWPSLTRTEMVLGRRVNVIDTGGSGPPLLFLHGLGGLWQNWLLNIPAFMSSYRVLAPDLPGFGRSEMPAGRISIQGFARVIDALCDRLDVENPVVVGNSMGGFIGAELALAFPTRVRKLVLISAAGISAENMWREPVMAVGRLMAIGAARTGVKSLPVVNRPRLRRAASAAGRSLPGEAVRAAGDRAGHRRRHARASSAASTPFWATRSASGCRRSRRRTLIVWGRNDVLIPVEDAYEFERLIGDNARVEVFEDTGHLAMLERPTRFNTLVPTS